jgi:hypothetical protein
MGELWPTDSQIDTRKPGNVPSVPGLPRDNHSGFCLALLEDRMLSRHHSLRGPLTAVTFPAGWNGPSMRRPRDDETVLLSV